MGKSLEERLWSRVEFTETCWNWTGCRHRDGHGKIGDGVGGTKYVHRVAYELLVGPIPENLVLDHLCRNTACVNPEHLEPVSVKINNYRSYSSINLQRLLTECPEGHPYDDDNTYHWRGHRRCRVCNAEKAKEYRDRKKLRDQGQ